MSAPPLLITPRLVGRRLLPEDLPEMVAYFSDRTLTATLGGPRSPALTAAWHAKELSRWVSGGTGSYVFRDPATREVVAGGVLRRIRLEGRDEVELGYSVSPSRWRQGLASEVGRALLTMGEEKLGAKGIIAFTLPWNLASRRTLERLGLEFEKTFRFAGLPHVLYRRPTRRTG